MMTPSRSCDVVILGSGIAGVAGALAADELGLRTSGEVTENLGALGWEISNADMAETDAILARNGAVTVPPGWLED